MSLRNVGIDHDDLRMSVLVQPVVDADYAFVIHTVNPSSKDQTELYAEVVMGPGRGARGQLPGPRSVLLRQEDFGRDPADSGLPQQERDA